MHDRTLYERRIRRGKANFKRLALASALALTCGWVGTAGAAAVITDITASGPGLGSFSFSPIDQDTRSIDMTKIFDSVNPITLTFTVEHGTGPANPYTISESIVNNTHIDWNDFHFQIIEPPKANGTVFTSFNQSTLSGFALDGTSGPRNLDFTGLLVNGGLATASFDLSPFDPGANNPSVTFEIIQTPSVVPEPSTWAMLIAGVIGVAGMLRRRVFS
jgi:hypothetical protein